MIYETEHFLLDCNKGYSVDNSIEFDCEIEDGLIIYKKYADGNTRLCDIIYDKKSSSCKTIFIDNSLVDNISDWPDYQEFARVLDEANYKVMLANRMREYNEFLK